MPVIIDSPDWTAVQLLSDTNGIGSWQSGPNLPNPTNSGGGLIHGNFIYVVGGNVSSTPSNLVLMAPINQDGTIGAWVATTPLPATFTQGAVTSFNGFIYVIGGQRPGGISAQIWAAPFNPDGTIGAWTVIAPLPSTLQNHQAICASGFMYVVAGFNGTGFVTTVISAPINPDGTIGAWTATAALPNANASFGLVNYANRLFVIGGQGTIASSGAYLGSVVLSAPITVNGTLGAWVSVTGIPENRFAMQCAVLNGAIYVMGGQNNYLPTGGVYYARVNSDGTINSWTVATPLPTSVLNGIGCALNGAIYVIGGSQGLGLQAQTFYGLI